jgi:hypothetical protein
MGKANSRSNPKSLSVKSEIIKKSTKKTNDNTLTKVSYKDACSKIIKMRVVKL